MNKTPFNADPAELAKFSALAARWWDPDSEFRPLHRLNPLRLGWIDNLVALRGKTVLDVGCGGGILAEAMAREGAVVTGIDLAQAPLSVATLHAQQAQAPVHYFASSAEELAQRQPHSFDVVTCMEMLEHVPQPALVIAACAQLVKPGGWVFFSTINRNPLSFVMAIVGAEYVLRLLPRRTHRWDRFIKPAELVAAAARLGLALQDSRGLGYNPFNQRFRLHRFMGVGYLLAMKAAAGVAAVRDTTAAGREAGP
jgi:2-polyprenyl-6-hydroxyphenyl methylase/3-demethylubiquinone-9 3-methyltransferase